MTLLSICIPLLKPEDALSECLRHMLESKRTDFEILVGDFTGGKADELVRSTGDSRLRMIVPGEAESPDATTDTSMSWNRMIPHAQGDWITIIGAGDFADPDICEVIRATVKRVADADVLSWGRARYVAPTDRNGVEIARIATGSQLTLPEQTDAMRSQFYWHGASDRPECHSGVWHGALRRHLLERTREAFSGVYFEQAAPDIDNVCKTVMLAKCAVHWERPLSVQRAGAGPSVSADGAGVQPFEDFPFSASLGSAASTALAIEAFKRRYGIVLDGWEDNFIEACGHDCENESSGDRFHARKAAYASAISQWRGKRGLRSFKPEFRRNPKLPRFRGVKDGHLHFDMAMDGTRSAAEFYRLIDAMLFPVSLLDDKLA